MEGYDLGLFFIHTAVTRLFDKTGKKGEYRAFIRENTGYFTKWVPATELPEFWRPSYMAHVKLLEKLFNLTVPRAHGAVLVPL